MKSSRDREGYRVLLLNAALGWRAAQIRANLPLRTPSLAAGDALRLTADPQGALALNSTDGSLGRLTLPRGMALDSDLIVYLLVSRPEDGGHVTAIRRFNPDSQRFEDLPEVGGWSRDDESPLDARRFRPDSATTILGKSLYVADPTSGRVQIFDLATLALLTIWDAVYGLPAGAESDPWQPSDVTTSARYAYILDRAFGRVYRHRPGIDAVSLLVDKADRRGAWSRIAVDRDERLYLYHQETGKLEIFACDEKKCWSLDKTIDDSGDVCGRFDPPVVTVEQSPNQELPDWFCLPSSLRRAAERQLPRLHQPTVAAQCEPERANALCFARSTGEPIHLESEKRVGLPLYRRVGVWFSTALDSTIYRCQWHHLLLDIERLPFGSSLEIFTYTSADQLDDNAVSLIPDESWQRSFILFGGEQETKPLSRDGLVQSREGQYLWLKVRLTGDRFDTPEVTSIRVQYPRDSYLKYLPAVFSQDEDSRWFLERYLSIVQTEWEDLEKQIRESARYFDPSAVPGGAPLAWLAGWFAVPLEAEWTDEQNRRLLAGVSRVYGRRGTVAGLRAWLQLYLQNLSISNYDPDQSGVSPEDQDRLGMPVLLESYRARRFSRMAAPEDQPDAGFQLGAAPPLWSEQVANRFQLGVNSREGEAQIVSTGDPQTDVLDHYAHRFEVYVPAVWVRSAADERILRRALDSEKPAHTAYELHRVEARFRIGVQAMLGVDSIIAALPTPQPLGQEPESDSDTPPSQEGRGRLGYDTVLGQAPGIPQRNAPRVGRDTRLI